MQFWINEGLMSVFFLLVGLELKREFVEGELSKTKNILLPGVAALGGMLIPAGIYFMLNFQDALAAKGWAIPVATDIAFALGVLSLLGRRIPHSLKMFLMALAIFDDVGAIIIIAIVHTKALSLISFGCAGFLVCVLWMLNKRNVFRLTPYLILGFLLWISVLKSGVHATVAGVILGFVIPIGKKTHSSPLYYLERYLHPWVAYFVLPLFAFANAGVSLQGLSLSVLADTMVIGIVLGLFLGKQCGVLGFTWCMVRWGGAPLPVATSWLQLYGVAVLCGIGFTMSLFLGGLAFEQESLSFLMKVKIGVLLGSVLSGIWGVVVLHWVSKKSRQDRLLPKKYEG